LSLISRLQQPLPIHRDQPAGCPIGAEHDA
jgi:hypothetical protein